MIEELAVYDIEFSNVEAKMVEWVEEALELRHGVGGIEVALDGDPRSITSVLVDVRTRSDRVDQLLANITRARGRVRRAQAQAKFVAETAYHEATQKNSIHRVNMYTSRDERAADAALDSLEQRRVAHQAERIVSVAEECYEVIRQVHWQLGNIRDDLRTAIKSLQFESNLER